MTDEQAFNKAAALCSRSEQCASQILGKLEQWETPNPQAVIRRLRAERYLDDSRYARAFACDKLRYNQWGRVKIRAALRMKCLGNDVIAEALQSLDADEYREVLDLLLSKKRRELERRESDSYVLTQKLARHAVSHGFEPSLVFSLLGTGDD